MISIQGLAVICPTRTTAATTLILALHWVILQLSKEPVIRSNWDDEDADDNEVKDSWEDDDEHAPPLSKEPVIRSNWDDEDADDNEVKDSWEDDDEHAPPVRLIA
ncbi:hypothetical protein ACLB2K_063786 [Fragaria x ananassa]